METHQTGHPFRQTRCLPVHRPLAAIKSDLRTPRPWTAILVSSCVVDRVSSVETVVSVNGLMSPAEKPRTWSISQDGPGQAAPAELPCGETHRRLPPCSVLVCSREAASWLRSRRSRNRENSLIWGFFKSVLCRAFKTKLLYISCSRSSPVKNSSACVYGKLPTSLAGLLRGQHRLLCSI